MGHHGRTPYEEMSSEELEKMFNQIKSGNSLISELTQKQNTDQEKFGPTGKFPMGHLNADDEGEIRIGITSSNGKIVIDFGKPIHWIGFSPEQAKQIAETLIIRANEIS